MRQNTEKFKALFLVILFVIFPNMMLISSSTLGVNLFQAFWRCLNTYISVKEEPVIELLHRLDVHMPIGPEGMHPREQLPRELDNVTALPLDL